jgi:hypothetical protein
LVGTEEYQGLSTRNGGFCWEDKPLEHIQKDKMKEMEKERMQMEQMLQQFKADLEASCAKHLRSMV